MYGPMRIGGLASGMDIDQIVSDLMRVERMKVDKLYQQKQVMEWQKADYREINLKLRSLYNTSFDMKLSSSYLKYKAIGTMNDGSSFEKFLSVTPVPVPCPGIQSQGRADGKLCEARKLKTYNKTFNGRCIRARRRWEN